MSLNKIDLFCYLTYMCKVSAKSVQSETPLKFLCDVTHLYDVLISCVFKILFLLFIEILKFILRTVFAMIKLSMKTIENFYLSIFLEYSSSWIEWITCDKDCSLVLPFGDWYLVTGIVFIINPLQFVFL